MEFFAELFNKIFGRILLLMFVAPPLLLFVAYLIFILVKTIQELQKNEGETPYERKV